ncbi:MAG: hypothetical protein QXF07_01375 [Candidatus Micrarchaeia archaeon]
MADHANKFAFFVIMPMEYIMMPIMNAGTVARKPGILNDGK